MKIQDRIGALEGVENVIWDGGRNRLIVYYSGLLDTIKVRVAGAIREANLQRAIEEIALITGWEGKQ